MKTLGDILLPDSTFDSVAELAQQYGSTPQHLCATILADFFGVEAPPLPAALLSRKPAIPISSESAVPGAPFNVAEHFPAYPRMSVKLAQQFVDEATKLPDVCAEKRGRGVGFEPRFAQIEYLVSFRGTPGIVVSLYGKPKEFDDPLRLLTPDRKSYSRARILDPEQLKYFLPFLKQAYERRYGKVEGDVQ
jgi:hypothetical protein